MQQQRQQRPQPQHIHKKPELLQRFAAPPPCAPHPLFINIRQPQHIIQNFCKRFAGGGAAPSPLHPPPAFFINNYNNYNKNNSNNNDNKRFVAAATATNGKQQGNDKTQIL